MLHSKKEVWTAPHRSPHLSVSRWGWFTDNYMHADDVFSTTVKFNDGTEMEIKCCGVSYAPEGSNTAWAEAVLFKNGSEIIHSNPRDRYRGEWEMTDNCGNTYTALVGPWANTGEKIKGA